MITDAELIERVRAADPAPGPAHGRPGVWSDERLRHEIEDRLGAMPMVAAARPVTGRQRRRLLAVAAAVVVIGGGLGFFLASSRSTDEQIITIDDDRADADPGPTAGLVPSSSAEEQSTPGNNESSDTEPSSADGSLPSYSGNWRIEQVADTDAEELYLRAATMGGPGVVAVGWAGDEAAVWTSEDGLSWHPVLTLPDGLARPGFRVEFYDVIAGGPGVVAVGGAGLDESYGIPDEDLEARDRCLNGEAELCDPDWPPVEGGAQVWTSTDGVAWTPTFTETSLDAPVMHAITAGGPGFVAVGSNATNGAVWTSIDGLSWTRVPDDTRVFADSHVVDVVSVPSGLVAVGSAVWASSDGLDWRLVSELDDPIYDPGDDRSGIRAVALGPSGFVGVGFSGIWTSSDGLDWTRAPEVNDVIGFSHLDVVFGHASGYVTLGQSSLGGPSAAFVSPDGVTWTEIPYEDRARPHDLVVIDGRVLVVGSAPDQRGVTRGAVWELVEVE